MTGLRHALLLAASAAALAFSTPDATAGYGTVSLVSRTTSTIRITYSHPGGRIRYVPGTPKYKVCWKQAWTWGDACSANTRYTYSRPYTITGLNQDTNYKIKVYGWTERWSFGRWRNRKYRLIDTKYIRTLKPVPSGDVYFDSWVDQGFGFGTLQGHIDWTDPADFDLIQVGYKFRGSFSSLNRTLKERGKPATSWGTSDENRGWVSFNPSSTTSNYAFSWVLNCRSYKIAAYAFRKNSNEGIKIGGNVIGRAGGNCDNSLFRTVSDDHPDLVTGWANELVKLYGSQLKHPVRSHLAKRFPDFGRKLSVVLEDEDVPNDYELIQYVIENEPEMFASWQKELAPIGMTLLDHVPPQLRTSIENEIETTATTTIPRLMTNQHAETTNALPFGQTRGLIQSWHAGATIPKGAISEIGWRAPEGAVGGATTHRIEIVLANTTRRMSDMTRSFAANFGNSRPITFLPMTRISVPALTGNANPNRPMSWLKGTRPFLFAGPHLIVQVRTETSQTYASLRTGRTQALRVEPGKALATRSGWSCAGQLDFAHQGSVATLTATNLEARRPVVFLFGNNTKLAGLIPLPMSLAPLGMGTCQLHVDPMIQLTAVTDANGLATLRLPVQATRSLQIHAQALHFSQSTAAGLATTNAANLLLGGGLTTQLYNLTRDGGQAEFGPFAFDHGPVLLVR